MGHIEFTGLYEMTPIKNQVVYTAVFGNYDTVPPVNPNWDCDFICFTDNPSIVSDGWQVVIVELNDESPAQANRRYKMLPHQYLPNYERSLYVDGNIKIVADPSPLFEKYLSNGVIAIPYHQDRNCLYKEVNACIKGGLVDKKITEQQMARYKAEGFPENFGITENGIIFRKHLSKEIISLMEDWWAEYCIGARRDQLSLPYLMWKYYIHIQEVTEGLRISTDFFIIDLHEVDKSKSLISQIAKHINNKRHLRLCYFFLSEIISIIIFIRDNKILK